MRRSLEGVLFAVVVLTAGWLGGPLVITDGSPLWARSGSSPSAGTCADSTTPLDCPTDPDSGNPCGKKYTAIVSGNLYWFATVGTVCNGYPLCSSSSSYGSSTGTCVGGGGGT